MCINECNRWRYASKIVCLHIFDIYAYIHTPTQIYTHLDININIGKYITYTSLNIYQYQYIFHSIHTSIYKQLNKITTHSSKTLHCHHLNIYTHISLIHTYIYLYIYTRTFPSSVEPSKVFKALSMATLMPIAVGAAGDPDPPNEGDIQVVYLDRLNTLSMSCTVMPESSAAM